MPTEEIEKYHITIGELAKKFDVSVSLIRYWEKEFKQFKPDKTEKGTRKYSKKNIETFSLLYRLIKTEGYTIEGAKEKLSKQPKLQSNQEAIEKLTDLKGFLIRLNDLIA